MTYRHEVIQIAHNNVYQKYMKGLKRSDIDNARKMVTRTMHIDETIFFGKNKNTTLKDMSVSLLDLMAKYGPETIVVHDTWSRVTKFQWEERETDEEVTRRLADEHVKNTKNTPEFGLVLEAAQKQFDTAQRKQKAGREKAKITQIKNTIAKLKKDLDALKQKEATP